MASITALFGSAYLRAADGSAVDTVGALAHKKVIGLYFSAHWCAPCRAFTPRLLEFYKERKAVAEDDFEIVFVSSDSTMAGFTEYSASMPWLSIPFNDRDAATALGDRFRISSIPALVLVNAHGKLGSVAGRDLVLRDPTNFPWGIDSSMTTTRRRPIRRTDNEDV